MIESFNGLYKWELIYPHGPWHGLSDVEFATLEYVDWYNHRRSHGQLLPGRRTYTTPADHETAYYRQTVTATPAVTQQPEPLPNPGVIHFTPTSSSWANLVESWFSILTRKALKTQAFTSVEHLTEVIDHWAAHWNHDPQPLKWTKTADQIIAKVKRARTALNKTATHH